MFSFALCSIDWFIYLSAAGQVVSAGLDSVAPYLLTIQQQQKKEENIEYVYM